MKIKCATNIKCDMCGKFCVPVDQYAPYGCFSYDPPEPYDERYICKKCFPIFKRDWQIRFVNGYKSGDWIKSLAEMECAKAFGMVWNHSKFQYEKLQTAEVSE